MKKLLKAALIGLFTAGSVSCCGRGTIEANDFSLLQYDSVHVALYLDNAVWPNCKTNTEWILNEIGLPYTVINTDSVLRGKLIHYSVLLMPGADMTIYYENLGPSGVSEIKNYVSRGGGYIGICGGAYFTARTIIWRGWSGEPRRYYENEGALDIFSGIADGPIEDFAPSYQDFNCSVQIFNGQHPVVTGIPDTLHYLYDHGPQFITGNNLNDLVLGRSINGAKTLLLVTTYYNGRIFLTGGHPEATNTRACRNLIENSIKWCSKQVD